MIDMIKQSEVKLFLKFRGEKVESEILIEKLKHE